jgi:ribose/xylose/arabinose/galactoside ABC-type transport system permease subunit
MVLGRLKQIGGIWGAVIVLYIVSGLLSHATLNPSHVLDVLQVASILGIAATGQTFVMLTGGIDLSVAGIITLANIVASGVMDGSNALILPGLAMIFALGAAAGAINGLLVTRVHITPLIVTLAMNSVLFGAALLYSHGAPHGAIPPALQVIGQGRLVHVPVSAILWLMLTITAALMARRTVFGRQLYAVGANPRAAHATGLPVDRTIVLAYVASGLLSAMAGLILTAYIGLPSIGIGDPYQLSSVAAVVIGGTALTGGVGSAIASAGGALFITQLNSLTNMLQMSTGTQFVIQGAVIAAGMALSRIRARGRARVPRERRAPAAPAGRVP